MAALAALVAAIAGPAPAQDQPQPSPGDNLAIYGVPAGPGDARDDAPEQVVAGLSSDFVDITTSFGGSNILLYGAVKRETAIPQGSDLQVIVTVQGPPQALTIRRKSRRLGVWVNTDSLAVGAAPSFYAVATSGPMDKVLRPEWDTRYRISVPLALRSFARPLDVEDTVPFTQALLRQRQENGIYRLDEGKVQLVDQTLYRADVALPANLIEGYYKTRIFLLRDGQVVDMHSQAIEVRKVGLERWLYQMAFDRPLLYGLMSLAVAVAAGWGASAAFRLLRRQ